MYHSRTKQLKIKKQKRANRDSYEEERQKGLYNPLVLQTPKEVAVAIVKFIKYCQENQKPLTMARLACYLKCSPLVLKTYSEKWEYAEMIEDVKRLILADKEERLNDSTGSKQGVIFDLINNHGYRNYAPVPPPELKDSPETVADSIQKFLKAANLVCIPPEGASLEDFENA